MLITTNTYATIHFMDGSSYQVENTFEDLVNELKNNTNATIDFQLPTGQKIVAVKNTISRVISSYA